MRHDTNNDAAANADKRAAAIELHQKAITTINELFRRCDELTAARDRLAGIATRGLGGDPIQDAEVLLEHAGVLAVALDGLRAAALDAANHRGRVELAADIGVKVATLFPRPVRRPDTGAGLSSAPAGSGVDSADHRQAC